MSNNVKLGLYVVLSIGALLFGGLAVRNYQRMMNTVQTTASTPQPGDSLGSLGADSKPAVSTYDGYSRAMTYGVIFFIMIAGLGLLIGMDVSNYFGTKALKVLYNDEGVGMKDPEYDRAEQVWADGQHLEAIGLMREYLKKNPREQHVAIRIAEIYEKDLQNNLAAALEYEEVLKHNLPRERWGWSAIHLCNLHFKLEQTEKAVALLRRIDAEYGETQAAEKARKRLAVFEVEGGNLGGPGLLEVAPPAATPPEPPQPGALPPGFKPLKRG